MPLIEVDQDERDYACPWSDCEDGTHPIPSKTARYTTPCGHPLGFLLNGALWIKPKRPAASKEPAKNLQALLGLDANDPFARLPYGGVNPTHLLKVWRTEHGQQEMRSALGWAMFGDGQGIPRHKKVASAFTHVERVLRAEDSWSHIISGVPREDTNDQPTEHLDIPTAEDDSSRKSFLSPGL